MLPWEDCWLRIASNGGGDYYVYVLAGAKRGKILFYLHDDAARSVVAPSLTKLAERIAKNLAARDKPVLATRVAAPRTPLAAAGAPSLDDLASAAIGTCFYRRSLPYRSYWYRLYIKATRSAWVEGKARLSVANDSDYQIDGALADANARLALAAVEWKVKPAHVVDALHDDQVWPSDLLALKGKDPRLDPYFVRLRGELVVV